MTIRSKIIFVNANGDFEETASTDILQYAAFNTATYSLTDALLGDVTNKMIKNDGTRAFAANQDMGGFKLTGLAAGAVNGDAIRYEQLVAVQNSIANLTFQNAVISQIATPPGTPTTGDRYLVLPTGTGAWAGHDNNIATWSGSAWTFFVPVVGDMVDSEAQSDRLKYFNGTSWIDKFFESTTASTGLTKVGIDIELAPGKGIQVLAGLTAVQVSAFAGQGVKDDGSNNIALDFSTTYTDQKAVSAADLSSTTAGKGAAVIGVSGSFTTQTTVQGALSELYGLSGAHLYTVGAGGITKGQMVYASANNTVSSMPITGSNRALGLALSTVAAAGQVEVKSQDYVLTGVLSGATFNTRYYWDGTTLTTTLPPTSGSSVWQAGIAINATDLLVELEFIKKNS